MKPEQQYIDLFIEHENLIRQHSTSIMNNHRRPSLEEFQRLGFPPMKEDYACTNVNKAFAPDYGMNINRIKIPVNPYHVFCCDVPHLNAALYFTVNDSIYERKEISPNFPEGVYIGSLIKFAETHPEIAKQHYGKIAGTKNDGIIAINTMFAQDGFVVYVPQNIVLESPIQLIHINRSDVNTMSNRRILVIMEAHSQAKLLVCTHSMDKVSFISTEVIEIFANESAKFDYYDLEETSELTTRFTSLHLKQETHSQVCINGITLNNGLSRNNYHIELNGEYAENKLCGMSILDETKHLDTMTHIIHNAPHCTSNELFKNILNGHSTGAFSGKILVKKGADKTSAHLTNKNYCSTRNARMYSKPQLEIYADDVKCSHGMTTGQMDENALFYMQSRGIPYHEARTLLSIAFTADVLDNIHIEGLKERLQALIEKRFRGELAHCSDCNHNKQ
ncbi:MAG: Fe-S cluster assembly protein SufD [Tannerellaceae bacterium]|jgi:Fe-S cluster assembly protein SufD|nr:Fe-S cluster assembly protein SufD [Tannerellaceae bacterium]